MDQVLKEEIRKGGYNVFINDIIVYTAGDEAQHLEKLESVLLRLREEKLYCKWKKCEGMIREVITWGDYWLPSYADL